MGTLCLIDKVPRHFSADQLALLRDLADMADSIASVDLAFGAILKGLDDAGLADDTLVMFVADLMLDLSGVTYIDSFVSETEVELATGWIKNHRRYIQIKILNVLVFSNQRAENMFGFLLTALKYGAPPHGGIALGLDRIAAIMTGTESIRDVIAFPKTTAAQSLMDGSPTPIDAAQLSELGLLIAVDSDDQ